jgi:hypothetical protein
MDFQTRMQHSGAMASVMTLDSARQGQVWVPPQMGPDRFEGPQRGPISPPGGDSGNELIRSGGKKLLISTGIGFAAGMLPVLAPMAMSNPYVLVPFLVGTAANSLYGLWGLIQMARGFFSRPK